MMNFFVMMSESVRSLVLIACVACLVRGEVFTSTAHLKATVYAERYVAILLKEQVQQERERLNKLEKLADDYEEHSRKAISDPSFYLGNPVNAFLLIKRLTLDWERNVKPLLRNDTWQDFGIELEYIRQWMPTFEDLTGAATALMRLQDTYRLDTSEIAHGDFAGVLSTPLSADDCFELGKLSYNEDDYYHTTLWMEESLSRLNGSEDSLAVRIDLLKYLALSYYQQGHVKHALTLTNQLLALADPKSYFEDMLIRQGEVPSGSAECPSVQRQVDSYQQSAEFQTYEALCRGEVTQKIKDEHKLMCRYVHNNDPRLLIQPIKEEEMHLHPWIVVYHDILFEKEMADIKMLATPRLERSAILSSVTGGPEIVTYRISKSTWLDDTDHPTIAKVNQKIQAVTGLDLETAEVLQIANYGIGGQYEPHYDFKRKGETEASECLGVGNRIATFLAYMTDVEAGGATVFPDLGLKLYPKKGMAAFWYNLYRNGDGIHNTRHAACPVLLGIKWVSNKWFHERGQEFRRPCTLSPDE